MFWTSVLYQFWSFTPTGQVEIVKETIPTMWKITTHGLQWYTFVILVTKTGEQNAFIRSEKKWLLYKNRGKENIWNYETYGVEKHNRCSYTRSKRWSWKSLWITRVEEDPRLRLILRQKPNKTFMKSFKWVKWPSKFFQLDKICQNKQTKCVAFHKPDKLKILAINVGKKRYISEKCGILRYKYKKLSYILCLYLYMFVDFLRVIMIQLKCLLVWIRSTSTKLFSDPLCLYFLRWFLPWNCFFPLDYEFTSDTD